MVTSFPVLNAIAFGAVEIGRMKAKLQATAAGYMIMSTDMHFLTAISPRIGRNTCAVETFDVNPVVILIPTVAMRMQTESDRLVLEKCESVFLKSIKSHKLHSDYPCEIHILPD